jgi:hypothetical protein
MQTTVIVVTHGGTPLWNRLPQVLERVSGPFLLIAGESDMSHSLWVEVDLFLHKNPRLI